MRDANAICAVRLGTNSWLTALTSTGFEPFGCVSKKPCTLTNGKRDNRAPKSNVKRAIGARAMPLWHIRGANVEKRHSSAIRGEPIPNLG